MTAREQDIYLALTVGVGVLQTSGSDRHRQAQSHGLEERS